MLFGNVVLSGLDLKWVVCLCCFTLCLFGSVYLFEFCCLCLELLDVFSVVWIVWVLLVIAACLVLFGLWCGLNYWLLLLGLG